MDAYRESYQVFYQASVAGPVGNSELTAVGHLGDIDTLSTERKHFRVTQSTKNMSANKKRLCVLSADDVLLTEATTSFWQAPEKPPGPNARTAGYDDADAVSTGVAQCGGGPWKALLWTHAQGQHLTAEVVSEFSARYRAIKAQAGERWRHYVQLGKIGTKRGKTGVAPFSSSDAEGKRRRLHDSAHQAPVQPAAVLDGDVDGGVVEVFDLELASSRIQDENLERVRTESSQTLAAERLDSRKAQKEEESTVARLRASADPVAQESGESSSWRLSGIIHGTADDFAQQPSSGRFPVLMHHEMARQTQRVLVLCLGQLHDPKCCR